MGVASAPLLGRPTVLLFPCQPACFSLFSLLSLLHHHLAGAQRGPAGGLALPHPGAGLAAGGRRRGGERGHSALACFPRAAALHGRSWQHELMCAPPTIPTHAHRPQSRWMLPVLFVHWLLVLVASIVGLRWVGLLVWQGTCLRRDTHLPLALPAGPCTHPAACAHSSVPPPSSLPQRVPPARACHLLRAPGCGLMRLALTRCLRLNASHHTYHQRQRPPAGPPFAYVQPV